MTRYNLFHDYLCRKFSAYHRWYQHPLHPHVHWSLLGAVVLGVSVTFGLLGWSRFVYPETTLFAKVVYAQNAAMGADDKTIDQRMQEWFARDGAMQGGYYFMSTHDTGARMHVFAWLENGTHQACRNAQSIYDQSIASCYQEDDTEVCTDGTNNVQRMRLPLSDPNSQYTYHDLLCVSGNIPDLNGGPEWYDTRRWFKSGSHSSLTLTRMLYQYGDTLLPADKNLISQALAGNVSSEYYFAGGPLRGDMQPQQWVVRFLRSIEDQGITVVYGDPSSSMNLPFTYNGTAYTPGQPYNSFQLSRDALFTLFDDLVIPGYRYELDSMTYLSAGTESLYLLHDFADRPLGTAQVPDPTGVEMKKRSKMILDLIGLDQVMEYTGNQKGGVNGRTYRRDYINGRDTYSYYYPWGLWYDRFGSAYFASSYRVPDMVIDLGVLTDEPNNYWHETHEAGGSSWMKNKLTFVTKSYTLGSSREDGKQWVGTVLGTDTTWGQPNVFWINGIPGDLDGNACNDDECYTTGGVGAYQYRNALLVNSSNPILHFAQGGNTFDVGQGNLVSYSGNVCRNSQMVCQSDGDCNIATDPRDNCLTGPFKNDYRLASSGWNFFQEGNVMMAIHMNPSSSWHAIEMSTEGAEYPSLSAFQSAPRSFSNSNSFTTGKGAVIEERGGQTYLNGQPLWSGGFPRLEVIDYQNQQPVSWSGKTMVVSKNGLSCTYDFNNWSTSGSGCGASGGGPLCTNIGPWQSQGCGKGTCSSSLMQQTRTVDPAGCTITTRCTSDPQCGGTPACTFNTSQCTNTSTLPKIRGDLNCDDRVGAEDLGILMHFWGLKTTSSQSLCRTQLDSIAYGRGYDDIVDGNDANLISICWGQTFAILDALPLSDSLKTKCLYLDVQINAVI